MKYRITVTLDKDERNMRVEAKHEYIEEESKDFLDVIFLSILYSCKKADRKAFYNAFAKFAAEDYDDAREFIEKELHNES